METKIKRWLMLLVGSIVFLSIGTIYAWSIFAAIFHESFSSWTSTELSSTFSIIMASFIIGNFSSGFISRKLTSRPMFILCAALIGLDFVGIYFIQESTLWLLYLSYGVVGGFGVGVTFNYVLSTVTKWFPDKIGTASGILMMCFAFSTLAVGMGVQALVNQIDWRIIFAAIGVLIALILILASSLLKMPGADDILPEKKVSASKAGSADRRDMTINEMLKTRSFWLFFFWGMLFQIAIYSVQGNSKQIVLDLDRTAIPLSTWVVTIFSVCNGLGRFLFGTLYDKFGRRVTMTIDTSLIIVGSSMIIVSYSAHSLLVMALGIVFFGFAYGGLPPTASAFAVDFFGYSSYSLKYGIINLFSFIGAFGAAFAGLIKDKAGSFYNMFIVLILLAFLALIISLFIKRKKASKYLDILYAPRG